MKKTLITLLLAFFLSETSFAETYFFNECKISDAVIGNYGINIEKNMIEVELKAVDGSVQNFSDAIKSIGKNKIISKKIKSGKGENVYFQYFLNSSSGSVIKLEYRKESGVDMEMFKLYSKRESKCANVSGEWDKDKIEKIKTNKEKKEITKAKAKLKKEQETLYECQGSDISSWTNCKGSYKAETGHNYSGIFQLGKLLKGISLYPGGAKYVGDFLNLKPDGYGTFVWKNGDRYYGKWKDGKSHGTGTKIWKDGREYTGMFKEDKLHGEGTFYYPDGKKYIGEFINGKRHGEGTFTYTDGTAFIGKFLAGKQVGLGQCIAIDGSSKPCKRKEDAKAKDFSNKNTLNVSIVAKKWVRISQYEANSKKGKKVMDQLKSDFEVKAKELCSQKSYNVLEKKMEILEVDETPAYGLETKVLVGINGVIECK